jgi:hypothetical protein
MQQNIKPYPEYQFEAEFKQTELYKQLEKDFDIITFTPNYKPWSDLYTARHWQSLRVFSAVPFYYLEQLDMQSNLVYDLGCGWNQFKKYYPNIVGVDPGGITEYCRADVDTSVDDAYLRNFQGQLDAVFSICALHFISMQDIRRRVIDFFNILKPGKRGFLSLNAARMLDAYRATGHELLNKSPEDLELWIRQELADLPFEIISFEILFNEKFNPLDNHMDGNIRIIAQK